MTFSERVAKILDDNGLLAIDSAHEAGVIMDLVTTSNNFDATVQEKDEYIKKLSNELEYARKEQYRLVDEVMKARINANRFEQLSGQIEEVSMFSDIDSSCNKSLS